MGIWLGSIPLINIGFFYRISNQTPSITRFKHFVVRHNQHAGYIGLYIWLELAQAVRFNHLAIDTPLDVAATEREKVLLRSTDGIDITDEKRECA